MTQAVRKIDQYHKMGYSIAQFNSVSLDAGVYAAIKRFHLSVFKTSQADHKVNTTSKPGQQAAMAQHKQIVLSFVFDNFHSTVTGFPEVSFGFEPL